jgi:PASTA domain
MGPGITWYDALGLLTTASAAKIQETYDSKTSLLRPELLAGAPSAVISVAVRAQEILDAARRALGDPLSREHYDETVGIRRSGGGLNRAADSPSEPGFAQSDLDFVPGNASAEALGGLLALTDWMAPHARRPRRIDVPDLRGLFYSAAIAIVGKLDLHIQVVRLTEHPVPVDGLVVDQAPQPPAQMHRTGELTVYVWHPSR